jgi:hypothetical protein
MTCYRNGSDTIVLSALDIVLYFKYYSIIHKKNINKQLFVRPKSEATISNVISRGICYLFNKFR